MNYKDKSAGILQQLKSNKEDVSLTDARNKEISFIFKLSELRPTKETPYAEIKDEEEYSLVMEYIIKEVGYSNFIFSNDEFDSKLKFLTVIAS